MSLIYTEQRNDNETTLSGLATEDIEQGSLVTVTASGAELADAPNDPGAVVEEGYTNGATTFNRSNGNFLPLGRVRGIEGGSSFPVTAFGERLVFKVVRDKSL